MTSNKNYFPDIVLDFLKEISERIRKLYEKKIVVNIIRISLTIASIFYLTYTLYQNRRELSLIKLDLSWLMIALMAFLFSIFMGSLAWWLILRSVGQELELSKAIYIHLYSNILKYLPGIGWQQGGKFLLSRTFVENNRTVLWAMTVEYSFLFSGGITVALCALPYATSMINIDLTRDLSSRIGEAWSFIIASIIMAISAYFTYSITQKKVYPHTKWISTVLSLITILLGWVSLSLALYLLGRSLTLTNYFTYTLSLFTTPISFLIGLAVIFVPGGIGVRESTMAYILQWAISPSLAVLIALLARIFIAIAELFAFIFATIIRKFRRNIDQ